MAEPDATAAAPAEALSLEALLKRRYTAGEYAVFFEVPDEVGTGWNRRADAIVIGLWGSTGRLIEGFEIKRSRSDWLRELKQVAKADAFISRCDKWWLLTADDKIAKAEEIPATWGWIAATKHGLRVQKPAVRLKHEDPRIDRLFAIGILRKMSEDIMDSAEVRTAIEAAHDVSRAKIRAAQEEAVHRIKREFAALEEVVSSFETASGLNLKEWRYGDVSGLAKALKELRGASTDDFARDLGYQIERYKRALAVTEAAHAELLRLPPGGDT